MWSRLMLFEFSPKDLVALSDEWLMARSGGSIGAKLYAVIAPDPQAASSKKTNRRPASGVWRRAAVIRVRPKRGQLSRSGHYSRKSAMVARSGG